MKIGHDLEMEVGRPAAVLREIADHGELLACIEGLPHLEPDHRVAAEVAVESPEPDSVEFVLEDDRGAVVAEARVVGHRVNVAGQGGHDLGALHDEEIDSEVDAAPLGIAVEEG